MKVNQQHGTAASHHPIRRHRRIDAARQEARHAAAGPGRQTAGPRLLPEQIEGAVRQHLDMNGERRVVEIDAPPCRLFDQPADFALHLRRRERQPLVGACRRDAKRLRCDAAEIAQDRRRQRREIVRGTARRREIRDAEHARETHAHFFPRRIGPELDLDPSHDGSNREHVEPRQCNPQVADEQLNEPRPVASLERQLFIVNDD